MVLFIAMVMAFVSGFVVQEKWPLIRTPCVCIDEDDLKISVLQLLEARPYVEL